MYPKPQIRNKIYVRGLPNYLSIKTIVAYFEKMGPVSTNPKGDKNVHLFKDKNGAFNGCCNIIFVGSRSARDAVLKLDEKEYKKTGCLIKVGVYQNVTGSFYTNVGGNLLYLF